MGRVFYAASMTIPPLTSWSSPKEQLLSLPSGIIQQWFIQGAPEHQHQVSVAIYHLGHRVFPEGEGEYFYPAEIPAIFDVQVQMQEGVRWLKLKGANTDDRYDHSVYFGVTVETVVVGWDQFQPTRI